MILNLEAIAKFNWAIAEWNAYFEKKYTPEDKVGNGQHLFCGLSETIIKHDSSYSIYSCLKSEKYKSPYKRTDFIGLGRVFVSKTTDLVLQSGSAPIDWVKWFEEEIELEKKKLLARFQSILTKKQTILKIQIQGLKNEINQQRHPNISEGTISEYEEEKQLIEDKYNQQYQTLIEEGTKQKTKIETLIKKETEVTQKQTQELFSKSLIPLKASTQLQNYEGQANKLADLKNEVVKLDSEIMNYTSIDYWGYLERLGGKKRH